MRAWEGLLEGIKKREFRERERGCFERIGARRFESMSGLFEGIKNRELRERERGCLERISVRKFESMGEVV